MPKNIVILMDGTSNEITADRTNILRLYGTFEKSDKQLVYYEPGVGTFGAVDAWLRFWRKAHEIWGLATGWGLDSNVKDAYRFLVNNYDNGKRLGQKTGERDSIFIFGFSRGAYSARVLAGFIHAIGLIEPRNLNLVDYAYRAYKQVGEDGQKGFAEVRLYERLLAPDRPPIKLVGLFDTVASVIEEGPRGIRLRYHAFTKKNPSVEVVRHALAINEKRTMFLPLLWPSGEEYTGNPFSRNSSRKQEVKEVWFCGAHGDVGGGYPESGSQLAKIPLKWMIDNTSSLGLKYRTRTVNEIVMGSNKLKHYVRPSDAVAPHRSMNWAWAILEFLPRRKPEGSRRPSVLGWAIPLFEGRVLPEGISIHRSYVDQMGTAFRPPVKLPEKYTVSD